MAIDIIKARDTQPINDKSAIVTTSTTGTFSKLLGLPETYLTIGIIENKYDNRFDNPSYYFGGGLSDGGTYSGDVDGGELWVKFS